MPETSQPKHSPLGGGGGGVHLLWQCIWQRCGNKLYFCGGPFSPHVVNLKDDRKKRKKGATISGGEDELFHLLQQNVMGIDSLLNESSSIEVS
jgi:hypothetical protein